MDLVENTDVEYYFDIPVAVHEDAIILEFKQEQDLEFDKEYPLLVEQDVPEHFLLHANAGESQKEDPSWIKTEKTSAPRPTAKGKKKPKKKVAKADRGRKTDLETSECEVCHSLFKNKDELRVHWQTHISYKCCQCNGLFPSMAALTDHAAHHNNNNTSCYVPPKSYMCSTCGETFPRPHLLVEHEYLHSGNSAPLYICEYCPYTNRLRARLSLHRRRRHGTSSNLVHYDCDLCGRTFNNKFAMRAHMERHMQERTYVCPVCNKAFLTKTTLNGHVAIHSRDPKVKPHKCIVCTKSYFKMPALRQHMMSHTKEKPFECEQCEPNRGFISKHTLKVHCLKYHLNAGCYP